MIKKVFEPEFTELFLYKKKFICNLEHDYGMVFFNFYPTYNSYPDRVKPDHICNLYCKIRQTRIATIIKPKWVAYKSRTVWDKVRSVVKC